MRDPYYSMAAFAACSPLSLLYTVVSHIWLTLTFPTTRARNKIPSRGSTEWLKQKKLAVVTGSNTGIGFEVSKRLVQEYGWDVILACRSKDKALNARDKINYHKSDGRAIVLEEVLDLSDFDSVRKFVLAVERNYDKIDILINNAGRNSSGRSPGNPNLDLMFQSNYLGHFLLTNLLLKNKMLLENDIGSRVINLSSVMHHFSKGESMGGNQFESIASPNYWKKRALYSEKAPANVYSASKLAAILHSLELNRKYRDGKLTSVAVNPGAVNSDIWRGLPFWIRKHVFDKVYLTTEEGSEPIIAAAVREDLAPDNDGVIYIQPYINPFSIARWFPDSSRVEGTASKTQGPMIPFTEMLAPYVGHLLTTARLPANKVEASEVLWKVSEDLIESS